MGDVREGIAKQLAVYKYGGPEAKIYPRWIKEALLEVDDILSCLREQGYRKVEPEKSFEVDISPLTSEMLGRYILGKLETSKALIVPISDEAQRADMLKRLGVKDGR